VFLVEEYIKSLAIQFEKHSHRDIGIGQTAYMKNRFAFWGIKAPQRRVIQRPFLRKEKLPPKEYLEEIVNVLWTYPQREFQYFGMELVHKYQDQFNQKDIHLLNFMITHKSWWDTVDYIAAHLIGRYCISFPENGMTFIQQCMDSGNLWLRRTSILFQLHYKDRTMPHLLEETITHSLGTGEFFIDKAIGWALRQYARTHPKWVLDFVERQELTPLSRREALKHFPR